MVSLFQTIIANESTMADLILIIILTFSLLLFTAILISYCKRHQNKTPHGLTGMCHKSGGTMCSSCSSKINKATLDKKGTNRSGDIHDRVNQ